ncbi:MAG TPA: YifB family Mg chelatase-like AAA ATPase [Planctomycetota bacterium]|nr:YifB family Mg chelatase-like AAA ATPase [Planctomycetota bacterium]
MHTVRVLGACLAGTGAEIVTVEARFDRREKERTEVVITGLPDPVLRESRGRLICALEASGLHVPNGRLFLNLVPAARRKSGEVLDLPLALGAATACGHIDHRALENALFLGEVGIDGALHAVPGGLSVALAAVACGVPRLFAPPATAREAAWIEGIAVHGARHIEDVIAHLCGAQPGLQRLACPDGEAESALAAATAPRESLDDVRGQYAGKLALAVAAAGGHGLLFIGPPGAGKSLLARRLASLAGAPDRRERLEITRILSAAGLWPGGLASERPFRAPHHTISYAGLVGGGSPPQPGEITLAHCGVLFLDELPEFRRETLEALRQPMESGTVLISRATQRIELPAGFQLVAAMNPCGCGYQGHPTIPCRCPPSHVARYRGRISGPLLDRFDLRVELTAPTLDELGLHPRAAATDEMTDAVLKGRVQRAREKQKARQGAQRNAQLTADQLDLAVPLDGKLRPLLDRVVKSRTLSARAVQSIRRVARTLADIDAAEQVGTEHVARAIALRSPLF